MSISGANMSILGPNIYILGVNMYILGANMYHYVPICSLWVQKCTFWKGTAPVTAFIPFFLRVYNLIIPTQFMFCVIEPFYFINNY